MTCNTPLMNSWHSFSPNGRWLVFSSKSRSPYTQMFLTHIDAEGRDSPAILIENSTAANRAVNIPEFVNTSPDGIERIDVPAGDFYRQFDVAADLTQKGDYAAAIRGVDQGPRLGTATIPRAYNNFGLSLAGAGRLEEAIAQYQQALALQPGYPEAHNNLGNALAAPAVWTKPSLITGRRWRVDPSLRRSPQQPGRRALSQGQPARCHRAVRSAALDSAPITRRRTTISASPWPPQDHLDEAVAHYRKAIEGSHDPSLRPTPTTTSAPRWPARASSTKPSCISARRSN
jgi:tetratricopeptide (TPR) repeat protein